MPSFINPGASVLWATCSSPDVPHVAGSIRKWLLPSASRVSVLTVAPVNQPPLQRLVGTSQRREALTEAARRVALEDAAHLGAPEEAVQIGVRWGKPGTEILAAVEETKCDVLVLGEARNRPLRGSPFGAVLRDAAVPVLVGRKDRDGPIVLVARSDAQFLRGLDALRLLAHTDEERIVLADVQHVRAPIGTIFLTYREHLRRQQQTLNDSRHATLEDLFKEFMTSASGNDRVTTVHADLNPRDEARFVTDLAPSLVIDGAIPSRGPAARSTLAMELECPVLLAR